MIIITEILQPKSSNQFVENTLQITSNESLVLKLVTYSNEF